MGYSTQGMFAVVRQPRTTVGHLYFPHQMYERFLVKKSFKDTVLTPQGWQRSNWALPVTPFFQARYCYYINDRRVYFREKLPLSISLNAPPFSNDSNLLYRTVTTLCSKHRGDNHSPRPSTTPSVSQIHVATPMITCACTYPGCHMPAHYI